MSSAKRIKVTVSLTANQLRALLNIACGAALASEEPRAHRQMWTRLFDAARKAERAAVKAPRSRGA